MTKNKLVRPTIFHNGSYAWIIKYLDVENEDHGKTYFDKKEIHIFVLNKDEATIRDTLLHELFHVMSEDIFDIIKTAEKEEVEGMEENYILLTTPRFMRIMTSNPELPKYIFQL